MIFFRSDYSTGTHPRILQALEESNYEHHDGYGEDTHCEHAVELIKKRIGSKDSEVHFFVGGTQTNLTATAAFLRPHEAVVAPRTAHVFVHETGALEATGHKVFAFDVADGKLKPEHIDKAIIVHEDEHMVKPKMVYISNSTEIGSIYSKADLIALRKKCDEYDLLLYVDGARMASALTCEQNDLTLNDLANLSDAFYLGGTKNGFLFGEALIINNPALTSDFRYILKQRGGLLAKGRLLGVQFEAAFEGNLYFEMAEYANKMASLLRKGIQDKGYSFEIDSPTNQIFPIFNNKKVGELEKEFFFYPWHPIDDNNMSIRLVTEWTTKEDEVKAFIDAI